MLVSLEAEKFTNTIQYIPIGSGINGVLSHAANKLERDN